MRKLKIIEHISLDGVIQHTPDDNGFPYGDWNGPYRTAEGLQMTLAAYGDGFDVLLGRHTYDQFSTYWPAAPGGPMADGLNAATKYVVTHHPDTLAWGPFEAVGPDIAGDVARIKAGEGPDLIVAGSSSITSTLLEHGLADELLLAVNPVLLGTGKRLFADGTPARAFEFVRTQTTPSGIVFTTYRAAGDVQVQA